MAPTIVTMLPASIVMRSMFVPFGLTTHSSPSTIVIMCGWLPSPPPVIEPLSAGTASGIEKRLITDEVAWVTNSSPVGGQRIGASGLVAVNSNGGGGVVTLAPIT